MSNLAKRTLVAVIFIPILLYLYYIGGGILFGFLAILTGLCAFELIRMFYKGSYVLLGINILFAVLFFGFVVNITKSWELGVGSLEFNSQLPTPNSQLGEGGGSFILFLAIIINGIWAVFTNKIEGSFSRIAGSLFAIIYPALGFALLYRLQDFHFSLIPALAILVWICDSAAYFIGLKFGRHRGVFLCSPQKSIEGFIAGFIAVAIFSNVLMYLFPDFYSFKEILFLSISVGIFGQYGDLFESVLKRDMKIKDSSRILPGHGGVLDRFDSLIIAAPVMYFLVSL